MIARRDIFIGGACLAAVGVAYGLEPRQRVSLLGQGMLEQILPTTVADWTSRDVGDLAAPATQDSLAAKLYGQLVQRVYQQASTGAEVMMLMAHGDSQTNELQLHRPEVCYPAFGFQLSGDKSAQILLARGVELPGRQLTANAPGRQENIIYWARLGEFLPISGNEQRLDRIRTAMRGVVADGLLARFSLLGSDPTAAFATLEGFVPQLLKAVAANRRPALVGTQIANAMTAAGV